MISKKMLGHLNHQLNREIYSAYLYLSMAAYATNNGLSGFANWYNVQSQEEMTHAMKFYNYINQQGGRVVLEAIEAPQNYFTSIAKAVEKTLEHEKAVTSMINNLVKMAKKDGDNATEIFLQWFITEQVEEESNVQEILHKVSLVGTKGGGLFMVDRELAQRRFIPPQVAAE